jgi:hypothetical protein
MNPTGIWLRGVCVGFGLGAILAYTFGSPPEWVLALAVMTMLMTMIGKR